MAFPGLATVGVFQFMWTWTEFAPPLVFVPREEPRPVSLGTRSYFGRSTPGYGMNAAGVTIAMLPVVLLHLLLQRTLFEGITAGASKS